MKRYTFNSTFVMLNLLISCLLISSTAFAQITVSHAKNGIPGQQDGFFYALPQTVLKIDFIVRKTTHTTGPYSGFAERMLGVSDVVKTDFESYDILDAVLSTSTEPDNKAVFFVRLDERATKDAVSMTFSQLGNGILLGVGDEIQDYDNQSVKLVKHLVNSPDQKEFSYYAESNLYRRIDTIIRNITIDTTIIKRPVLQAAWVDRSSEQKARSAADYIQTIRQSRFNLVSGYQEINYGNTLIYMDKQLQQLEEAYLSLFLGHEHSIIEEHTVYFTPQKNDNGLKTIARFAEESGVIYSGTKGVPLQVELIPAGNTQNIPAVEESTLESITVINSMLYRVPETVEIRVIYQGKLLDHVRIPISQMGAIAVAPLSRSKLRFDPETGQIIQLKRD